MVKKLCRLKELSQEVARLGPADAHDAPRRAPRRRGDGGDRVVQGIHGGPGGPAILFLPLCFLPLYFLPRLFFARAASSRAATASASFFSRALAWARVSPLAVAGAVFGRNFRSTKPHRLCTMK